MSGQTLVADAGVSVWKRWDAVRSILAFVIDESFVARIRGSDPAQAAGSAIDTMVGKHDPIIERLIALGRRELSQGGLRGRLYLEGLAIALVAHLLQGHDVPKPHRTPYKGGLAPKQFRRVTEYISANLNGGLGLADMADIAGLSMNHFAEAFKATAGTSPHRYVLERRLDRARDLLHRGERSIAEIAFEAGFSSQSHLTANFRRVFGITPGRFRRSLR